GSFQAVTHMLADVKVGLEYARPVVHRAAWSVARGAPHRAVHVSMAKHQAAEAAEQAARRALQAHGAIGYTWEQDLHIWMRRAWSLARAWGDAAFHRARVAEALRSGDLPIGPGTTFRGDT
ncbi:MAG: acyl-CoA dehydrogenase family protein, partial [Myxococcota bacterium]|nr:acyl-CoA dehydrogenase family protein [Myxococcota bacterium]